MLSIIRSSAGDLFCFKDHFLFTGQLVLHLIHDQAQMPGMGYVVQIVCRDGEYRAKREVLDPLFVEVVQAGQVFRGNGAFIIASAAFDAIQ